VLVDVVMKGRALQGSIFLKEALFWAKIPVAPVPPGDERVFGR